MQGVTPRPHINLSLILLAGENLPQSTYRNTDEFRYCTLKYY